MGRRVDIDDLLDTVDVADVLGLGSRTAVSVYRQRHDDFPLPVIDRGRCLMWLRADILAWKAKHPGRDR